MSKSLFDKMWQRWSSNLFQMHMYILSELGTRGGISYISNRYSKAKNKYLKSYDSKQESKIIYIKII